MSDNLTVIDQTTRIEHESEVDVGQWFWVKKDPDAEPWLGCIVSMGSNYVEVESPYRRQLRVHVDDFFRVLTHEPNAGGIIRQKIQGHQQEVMRLMGEVQRVSKCLGVSKHRKLTERSEVDPEQNALVALSQSPDVSQYKTDLVKAKEKTLPDLFKLIGEQNKEMSIWMVAEALPLKAQAEAMKGVVGEIEDRIFNVTLYAGLSEEVIKVRGGEPAAYDEKLHLMQRKLFMDEECLLGYRVGGMEFKDLGDFDDWLTEEENFNRIFPFPRCMVAFQVRRNKKEREDGGCLQTYLINIRLEDADRETFLYIRNGEQLYCMGCDLKFGEMIFPDEKEFDPSGPMMAKMYCGRVEKVISLHDYEVRVAELEEKRAAHNLWFKKNPFKQWLKKNPTHPVTRFQMGGRERVDEPNTERQWKEANPHRDPDVYGGFRTSDWSPFDQSNVYFDEILGEIQDRIKYYNRVALIIQGLFDRSPVLHPHAPAKLGEPGGFEAAVKLVYDGMTLYSSQEPPDFEAYCAELRESLNEDSVVIGQEKKFLQKEAEKENKRTRESWNYKATYHEEFSPYGNDGPGYLAKMVQWKARVKKAVFQWYRKREKSAWVGYKRTYDPILCKLTVEAGDLFNVSAYKPGDFKQFFQDPRTRREYLKWAPMLLTAEEYHAGNIKPQVFEEGKWDSDLEAGR